MYQTPDPSPRRDDLPTLAEMRQIDDLARGVARELGVRLHQRPDGSIVHLDPFHSHGVAAFGVVYQYVESVCCPYQRLKDRATWVAMLTPWRGTAGGLVR
jgi:hypothetical protein